MSDLNAFFKRHYPADHATAWETRSLGGTSGRAYTGKSGASPIFPKVECADGFSFSAQGHFGGYCWPKDDFAEEGYKIVELLIDGRDEPLLADHRASDEIDGEQIYGHVPVATVEAIIDAHGGFKA